MFKWIPLWGFKSVIVFKNGCAGIRENNWGLWICLACCSLDSLSPYADRSIFLLNFLNSYLGGQADHGNTHFLSHQVDECSVASGIWNHPRFQDCGSLGMYTVALSTPKAWNILHSYVSSGITPSLVSSQSLDYILTQYFSTLANFFPISHSSPLAPVPGHLAMPRNTFWLPT